MARSATGARQDGVRRPGSGRRPDRPLTPPVAAVLVGLLAILLVAGGVAFGQAANRIASRGYGGATWSADEVVVDITTGSRAAALLVVLVVCLVIAAAAFGTLRLLARRLPGGHGRRRAWSVALAAVGVAGVVATVAGYSSADSGDTVDATWVIPHLLDDGGADAELLTGTVSRPRVGGTASEAPRLPAEIGFGVDGSSCTFVVDDPVTVVDGALTFTPRCA